ncbi:unnamed protein product [Cylicocyclus nassatus]|uniref:Uncharacterized protein n=1 Tax=Cylicocyclus nassatus TaxID=53992 RepID=A0AA36M4N9_CYLNA|nr:unnamed protein product [Cylicocyclus nassatus]
MQAKFLSCITLLIIPTTATKPAICKTTSDYTATCTTGANLALYVKIGNKTGVHPPNDPFFYYHEVKGFSVIKVKYGRLLKPGSSIVIKNITCRYCQINFEPGAWYLVSGQYYGGTFLWMDRLGFSEKWQWFLMWKVWALEYLWCLK